MAIYIIGDLHLSFSSEKPMDVFGKHWLNHYERIAADWQARVAADDLVILAGDNSWALSLQEAAADLAWIDALPGKKIMLKGNHDYWWTTLKKMRNAVKTIDFLQNNSHAFAGYSIVGTRGWDVPPNLTGDSADTKIYLRECNRLKLSIAAAAPHLEKICVLHYPPFDDAGQPTPMIEIIEQSGIKQVYFGHIHANYQAVKQGVVNGISYRLISCDYLDFKLHKIV